jgi:hypothetical protein
MLLAAIDVGGRSPDFGHRAADRAPQVALAWSTFAFAGLFRPMALNDLNVKKQVRALLERYQTERSGIRPQMQWFLDQVQALLGSPDHPMQEQYQILFTNVCDVESPPPKSNSATPAVIVIDSSPIKHKPAPSTAAAWATLLPGLRGRSASVSSAGSGAGAESDASQASTASKVLKGGRPSDTLAPALVYQLRDGVRVSWGSSVLKEDTGMR